MSQASSAVLEVFRSVVKSIGAVRHVVRSVDTLFACNRFFETRFWSERSWGQLSAIDYLVSWCFDKLLVDVLEQVDHRREQVIQSLRHVDGKRYDELLLLGLVVAYVLMVDGGVEEMETRDKSPFQKSDWPPEQVAWCRPPEKRSGVRSDTCLHL